MRKRRPYLLLLLSLILFSYATVRAETGEKEPLLLPAGLKYAINAEDSPERILNSFLGIPYRVNGGVNEKGNYVLFNRPERVQITPGLNCSGFVLAASRFLLDKNIALSAATRDRLGDSSGNSDYGQDWDFGWDLILNIAEGFPANFILPGGQTADVAQVNAFSPRGYDLHDPSIWLELQERLEPGYLYLVSFNKDSARRGYAMLHYHVGLMYADNSGNIWLYNTTGAAGKVYRRNLSDKNQRAIFLRSFANSKKAKKYLLILAVKLPAAN